MRHFNARAGRQWLGFGRSFAANASNRRQPGGAYPEVRPILSVRVPPTNVSSEPCLQSSRTSLSVLHQAEGIAQLLTLRGCGVTLEDGDDGHGGDAAGLACVL